MFTNSRTYFNADILQDQLLKISVCIIFRFNSHSSHNSEIFTLVDPYERILIVCRTDRNRFFKIYFKSDVEQTLYQY